LPTFSREDPSGISGQGGEIKIRAERRGGELIPRYITKGGNPKLHDATLKDLGIEKTQSSRWQQIASIPEAKKFLYPRTGLKKIS